MITDGLWDPYKDWHMGNAGELCARELKFTREAQDEFARTSYQRALGAQERGDFKAEITPVKVKTRKGEVIVADDEEPKRASLDKMSSLKPAFDKDGTITAANASKINDGASALILAGSDVVAKKKLSPLARVVGYASYAHAPEWFTTAPVHAIEAALARTGLSTNDIDLYEINEAFAVVAMAAIQKLSLDPAKVNVRGGAVALGHPIGASGARILTTLLYALKDQNKKRGLATLCIGGGEAVAVIVERV
jgi:acetyl-CoA C-acetyltransferase